ncbi:hypothetical protein CPT03_16850 [Pedobacter ginsengisoli]|uniref:ISL3 family transposase n=1 Tax=Pedobacter ginsengisoli TaxID=363852 RepID=A0A2D1U915_9SPHI|nr:ISL3 family transposase [Pedobacter ginsengisoli]ATP58014.1 hypothetical protein CPT03_16850 [Pedobacter ginsengisoli]
MNIKNILFSTQDKFKVVGVENGFDQLRIYVQSKQKNSVCPNCCMPSRKVHSYYTRTFHDLPAFGKASLLFLRSRRFYCLTDECALGVFSERFSTYFSPYKRRTSRLEKKLLNMALNAGGKPAERLCKQLSISISDTILLRLIHNAAIPEQETLTAIGVDDWAYKNRDRYGSILVDLHTRKIIDLLPDREESTLRKWLKEMPGINIITRDRYGKYQKAATKGAPQTQQVTDSKTITVRDGSSEDKATLEVNNPSTRLKETKFRY